MVHQPASPSIWPAVHSLRWVYPHIQGRHCGAYVGAVEEIVCVSVADGGDGCVLPSSLCKYTLKKGDLFVLNWARV